MSLRTLEIPQCCKNNSTGFIGKFPEGSIALCSEHYSNSEFMKYCSKLFLFPSLKEVPFSQ